MTKEELRDLRPGDYIWYSGAPAKLPVFLFLVVGRMGDVALFLSTLINQNKKYKGLGFFEMPRGWSWRSYRVLKREAFLNGENPWQTMVV